MHAQHFIHALAWLPLVLGANQTIRSDPMTKGPALEVVHLYNGQWPTGITVSSTGRKFSCYPAGLDMANTNTGLNGVYQVAEIVNGKEVAYPNASYNNPPGGSINSLHVPPVTKGDSNYLLGVQSVVIDSTDTLWILDTGRVIDVVNAEYPMLNSSAGGPKLISVDLATNKVTKTITFPTNVAYPDSYFNDVRFDRRPSIPGISGKQGVAYITDSSLTGRNGIVVVNLSTGKSWRQLENSPTVHPIYGSVPFVYGSPMYQEVGLVAPTFITFGTDGIAISPDGETLYYSVIGGRFLYSVPTAALRKQGTAVPASDVRNLGEKGISDGMETDTNGIIYAGNVEQDAISMYDPTTTFATIFVRDPRINWVDTMSVSTDGYLYFTVNQLNYLNAIYPGTGPPLVDRREKPYVLFRVPLPNGGKKIALQ